MLDDKVLSLVVVVVVIEEAVRYGWTSAAIAAETGERGE